MYKAASKLLIAIIALSFLAALIPIYSVHASTTTTATITASYDGFIKGIRTDPNATTGIVDDTNTTLFVGTSVGGDNMLNRAFVFFDVSSIPVGVTVTGAVLSLNVVPGGPIGTQNITIQTGAPSYPTNPLEPTDFERTYYSGNGGTRNSSTISGAGYWNITLNSDGLSWLEDSILYAGEFKICLRTNLDISGDYFTTDYVDFYSVRQGAGYEPVLYVTYTTGDYNYTFNGVYDENIGSGILIGAANVTAYYNDGTSPITFTVNNTKTFKSITQPQYFYYNIWQYSNTSDTALHREYWLGADETSGNYTIFGNQQGLIDIVFTIRALGGAGLGSYVTVQRNIDGTLRTVEKRPVDSTGTVVMSLQAYTLYSVSIEGTEPNTSTTFGNINTYTTPIILTVSALSFPSSTLQQYRYLRIWASRPTSTEIMVNYQDTNLQTVSVEYEIVDGEGVIWYNYTHVGENSFSDIWVGANSNTTYYLRATVVQSTFGTSTFNQVLARDGATSSPIDLSFLGSWTFNIYGSTVTVDSTQVFWAIVVLIVFGSFSVLNAYVGAFAGVASAAILVWLGWLNIPAGAIALAFAFTVVMGIAVYKRRGN